MEVALISEIELLAFYPESNSPLERWFHLIYPVHALRIYLCRVKHSWDANRSLFIHWDKAEAHHPISKEWISASLNEVIHHVFCQGVNRTMLFVPILIPFRVWQLPGLKLPACRL